MLYLSENIILPSTFKIWITETTQSYNLTLLPNEDTGGAR